MKTKDIIENIVLYLRKELDIQGFKNVSVILNNGEKIKTPLKDNVVIVLHYSFKDEKRKNIANSVYLTDFYIDWYILCDINNFTFMFDLNDKLDNLLNNSKELYHKGIRYIDKRLSSRTEQDLSGLVCINEVLRFEILN